MVGDLVVATMGLLWSVNCGGKGKGVIVVSQGWWLGWSG